MYVLKIVISSDIKTPKITKKSKTLCFKFVNKNKNFESNIKIRKNTQRKF